MLSSDTNDYSNSGFGMANQNFETQTQNSAFFDKQSHQSKDDLIEDIMHKIILQDLKDKERKCEELIHDLGEK